VLLKTTEGKPAYILGSIHDISDRKLAESGKDEEKKRAEHYLDIAQIMIMALDRNGLVTLINRKGCKIIGCERNEVIGKNWFDDFVSPGAREKVRKAYERLMAGDLEPVREFEHPLLGKDGKERIVSGITTTTTDARGAITGSLGSVADVTEQRLTESTIRHLSTFPQLSPNPVIEITMKGDISYANDAALKVLSEVGRSDILLFFGNNYEELLHFAVGNKGSFIHRETEIESRTFAETIEYIEQFECVRLYATDITERKKAENSLRTSEIRFRELFDNISSGVAIYEARESGNDFIFSDFNKAGERIDNERKEDLIGKSVLEKRPGIREFGLLDVMKRVWETGIPEHFPRHLYTDDRMSGWYENFVYKLPSGEIVAVFDNITGKKQAEEALVRREQELSNLSARLLQVREEERVKIARNVHDDIGHTAMTVKMDVFLLERCITAGSPVEQALAAIEAMKEHLDEIVESIQRISLEIRPPMLYDLGIADAVSFFIKRFARQTGIACKADIWSDIPALGGERAIGVYRIIQEAFTNVYRHANAAEIDFAMHRDGNELYVSIADNGKGIEDRFINNVHSLGLLGMKERTHLLGGTIGITRRERGGTEVILRTPLV
jgi:PAS domain S-box-containing protein